MITCLFTQLYQLYRMRQIGIHKCVCVGHKFSPRGLCFRCIAADIGGRSPGAMAGGGRDVHRLWWSVGVLYLLERSCF